MSKEENKNKIADIKKKMSNKSLPDSAKKALQKMLHIYTKMLAEMADVEDLTKLED